MVQRIAITGATGHLGGAVARLLAQDRMSLRLVVRSPEKAPQLANTQVAQADYSDTAALQRAFADCDAVFMVSATEDPSRLEQHRNVVTAAANAGVGHLVYTSFAAAAPDATFTFARDHYATEQMIRASGIAFTFLRDNFYMEVLPSFAGDDHVLRGPAGDGKVAMVARADVAASAAAVLREPKKHADASYEMTGPQAFTMADAAAAMTQILGDHYSFENETVEQAYESRKKWPAQQWQYDAWVSTYTAIASGELSRVSQDVEHLTGRPATDLRSFLESRRDDRQPRP